MVKKLLLGLLISYNALGSSINFDKVEQEYFCNVVFMSFLQGYTSALQGPAYTEEQIKLIVKYGIELDKKFVTRFTFCKDIIFDEGK